MNGGNRDGRYGLTPLPEYVAKANAETFVGLQIETKGAIDAVAELAALPDVDLLFVGPADISQVLGVPGDFENPRCLEIIERIASACRDAGKPWGIVPRGPEYAQRMVGWGCQMFVLAFDIHIVHAGVRRRRSVTKRSTRGEPYGTKITTFQPRRLDDPHPRAGGDVPQFKDVVARMVPQPGRRA